MFPLGAFFGIFWSFTPLIICFVSGIRDWFIDDAGKVVICVFSSIFLLNWINIYIAGEFNRQKLYPTHAMGRAVEDRRQDLNRSIRSTYQQEKEKEEQRKVDLEAARLAEEAAVANQQLQQPPGTSLMGVDEERKQQEMKFALEMAER